MFCRSLSARLRSLWVDVLVQMQATDSLTSPLARAEPVPFREPRSVLEAGCSAEDVGVITPYMAQVRLLRMLWRNRCQEQMGRGMRLKPLGRYENRKRSARGRHGTPTKTIRHPAFL